MAELLPNEYYDHEQLIDAKVLDANVAKYLNWVCDCGWAIGMKPNLIQRRCLNPFCPVHMGQRADYLFKYFSYANIGPATLQSYCERFQLRSHFEVLNPNLYKQDISATGMLMTEYARRQRDVYLFQIAELASIPGLQSGSAEIFNGYNSFEQYFKENTEYYEYKDLLIGAQKYFNVLGVLSRKTIDVMITGSLVDYKNRERFIDYCNKVYGSRVFIRYSKTLKRSADVLICDSANESGTKMRAALTPRQDGSRMLILTSREFLVLLEHNFGNKSDI